MFKFLKISQSYLENGIMDHLNFMIYYFLYIEKYTLKISGISGQKIIEFHFMPYTFGQILS